MENYFASQREVNARFEWFEVVNFQSVFVHQNIFRNVAVLIYVFDVESREVDRDARYYQNCLESLMEYSKDTKIFCLIHKMDLLAEDQREVVSGRREGFRVQ